MIRFLALMFISSPGFAGYITGTIDPNDDGFDFWVSINSDFLGETIKDNFTEPGELSVDKCTVDKLDFDVKLQSFRFRGNCQKKRNSEIKKMQDQTP